jgi:hypothetical protein
VNGTQVAALGGFPAAVAALVVGGTAMLLAFASLTRPAARLARWPLASALLGGGWIALACGLACGATLDQFGPEFARREAILELRPLGQLGLAWIGLLVGLQMKGTLLSAVPQPLWRWVAIDACASFAGGAAIAFLLLRMAAPGIGLGMAWSAIALVGAATIGWSGELRSLHGLDTRAARATALIRAGAGLGSALAIVASDLIAMSPEGARSLWATLAISGAAALALRATLGAEQGSQGRLTLALLGTLALVAGAAAHVGSSPLPGAFLLGMVITNLRGGSMRRLERLVSESEPAVAAVFFLLAGILLTRVPGWWPWMIAGSLVCMRIAIKPLIAHLALADAWNEQGARRLRAAPMRQAPIAVALAVAALLSRDSGVERGMLLALVAAGVGSGVLPLLWRART